MDKGKITVVMENASSSKEAALAYLKNAFNYNSFGSEKYQAAGFGELERGIFYGERERKVACIHELGTRVVDGRISVSEVPKEIIGRIVGFMGSDGIFDQDLVQVSAYNLGRMGIQEAIPGIRELLDYENDRPAGELGRLVRRDAAVSLAILGDVESAPRLRESLLEKRDCWDVLGFVALSLSALGKIDDEVANRLLEMLRSEAGKSPRLHGRVNEQALFALIVMGKGKEVIIEPNCWTVEQLITKGVGNGASRWAAAYLEKAERTFGGSSDQERKTERAKFRMALDQFGLGVPRDARHHYKGRNAAF